MDDTYIYKSTGQPLGFIRNDNLYSPYGVYLGWKEDKYIWDSNGQFRGNLNKIGDQYYILKYLFDLAPIPQSPRRPPNETQLPTIPNFINPAVLPIGYKDGF